MPGRTAWIAADWGTSNLRLWALAASGAVLAVRSSPKGMGTLAPDEFEPALLELAGDLLAPDRVTMVLVCGMAGARQGWAEAPYRAVPCAPAGPGAIGAHSHDGRLSVRILPGLSQARPPDVMRGEETQLAGFLAEAPGFDGIICLPGTHTKWVRLSAGEVQEFHTVMTGETFAFYSRQSVLRHALDSAWDEPAFLTALDEALARPESVATSLFAIRARSLLADAGPGTARARLSGLLIGLELAATRSAWQGRSVVVIGTPGIAAHYVTALNHLGTTASLTDGAGLVLAGLRAAYQHLQEQST